MRFSFFLFFLFWSTLCLYAQELTYFELEERENPVEEDSVEVDWLSSDSDEDTLHYSAVDLSYDVQNSIFNLNQNAQLVYRSATLDGDTIWFDQKNSVLVASGDPILREAKNPSLAGFRMKYNLRSKVGEIYYATTYQDNQKLNGMEVRRLPDGRLHIDRGDFSTCDDSTHQHFYFYGRRMVIKPKESVTARPVVLNIADVPVAVLPMIVAPLKSGRKSGLLTPKFGGDQLQGFYMRDLGVYIATSDYWDATLKADIVEGSQARFERTTFSALTRYKKRYVLDGNVAVTSYLDEFDFGNSGYDISFSHKQNLTPDARHTLTGMGSFVSSQSIRQDYALDAETVLNQQANAQMTYAARIGNNQSLTVKMQQQHNLVTNNMERQIPDIQHRVSGPLFSFLEDEEKPTTEVSTLAKFNYSLNNRFNLYSNRALDSLENKDTTAWYSGYTGNLVVDYSGSFLDVINITPRASFRGHWTGRSWENPEDSIIYRRARTSFDPQNNEYGHFAYNHSYSLNTDTKLYGIWVPEWGRFTGLRHVLSPSVSYTYAPSIDSNRYFVPHPLLAQSVYQQEQQTIGLSLSNDFDIKYLKKILKTDTLSDSKAKEEHGTRRLFTTRHSTSYNFAADSLHWSNLSSSFGLQLLANYIFTVRTTHNVYHRFSDEPHKVQTPELTYWGYEFSRSFNWNGDFNAGLPSQLGKYELRRWNAGFSYNYGFSSERVGKTLFQDRITHSSSVSASFQPTINWELSYSTRYDYSEGSFVTHQFTFNRRLHCWQLDFSWTPKGPAAGWSFSIYVRDIPDIKLNAGSTELGSY